MENRWLNVRTDSELVDRIVAGEPQAYVWLIERYERLARAAALQIVRDAHLADDVVQESLIAAFQSLLSLRERSHFGAWLIGIVRRQASRTVRKQCRSPVLAADANSSREPQVNIGLTADSMELLELVERLPEQERVVIGLRHFDGNSVQEIARILRRPVGTVTKQLSRAHQRLREWLMED